MIFAGPRAFADVPLTPLVSFNISNGSVPAAGLVQGPDGNFYGTTETGGASGNGVIFKMTPAGLPTTLASFDNTNGANPYAELVRGANNVGTIFEITPGGALTRLISLDVIKGTYPVAGLALGADGNFYGTTPYGGVNFKGTVFRFPSLPWFLTSKQAASAFVFTRTAAAGQNYQVQFTTHLAQTNWNNLGGSFTATNSTATASDPVAPNSNRLDRVHLLSWAMVSLTAP